MTVPAPDSGATDTSTIAPGGPGGTSSGSGLTCAGARTCTPTGTAGQVAADRRGLTFPPVAGEPGSRTTPFRLTDRSGAAARLPAADDTAGDTVVGRGTANADTGVHTGPISGLLQGRNGIAATRTLHGLTSARGIHGR